MALSKVSQSRVVLFTTFLAFCTLYTLQPLLPQLVEGLNISMGQAALLVTVTLVPMGLAPIFYGYFLQAIPAKTMLRGALFLLIIDQVLLFFAGEYWQLILLRFLQGLILPALFTALMTYCSKTAAPDKVRNMMGWYVASTIVGGCLSRALSGLLATRFDWQWMFLVLGVALLLPYFLTRYIDADAEISFAKIDTRAVSRVLTQPAFVNAYLALVFTFFVFGGMLALIPFRLNALNPDISSLAISLVYIGYIIGVPAAIFSDRLVVWCRSERTVLLWAQALVATGVAGLLSNADFAPFIIMLPLAGGMFLIHSTLTGHINHLAGQPGAVEAKIDKGVVNGLYVAVYYLSGTLGSWIPVIAYQHLSWRSIIGLSLTILLLSVFVVQRIQPADNP